MMSGMKHLPYDRGTSIALLGACWRAVRQRVAGVLTPMRRRPFLSSRQRRAIALVSLAAAFVVQVMLLWLLGELVSLSISLMELWAELARKHLEITLDLTP